MLLGFGLAALAARAFHPHYLPLCDRINSRPGVQCTEVTVQSMIGLFVIGLGIITLMVVPVMSSLYHLIRYGHDWETPRGAESAITNLPILGGLIYLAAGAAVAIAGY
jgi:hypothetical protein